MPAKTEGITPNASRLLWAGFMAILAAGFGFAIRGCVFADWGKEYGFTAAQLGAIGGAGFSGFCFGIIIGGVIVDRFGYGRLVALGLLGHIASAFVTFAANTPENAFNFLSWGMFIFACANGALEAAANPLVATLYPKSRTHYLNILHASWPAGMMIGVLACWFFGDKLQWGWKRQFALSLVPTALYALLFIGKKFPESEAAKRGASFGQMFKSVGILGAIVACYLLALLFGDSLKGIMTPAESTPEKAAAAAALAQNIGYGIGGALLLGGAIITRFSIGSILLSVLFITQALVGVVELGTGGWIQNITGSLFTAEQGRMLFLWTSAIMFSLRFCARFIEKKLKLSPIGLLLICAALACLGLVLASGMNTFPFALLALGIFAVGKTFLRPTMLAVVGDRFPQTGAVAMSIMGGIGILSAGFIGGPGLGYGKDRFAGEELKQAGPALFAEYNAPTPTKFLNIGSTALFGLDSKKLGEAKEAKTRTAVQTNIIEADQRGDRRTIKAGALVPAAIALLYLLLFLHFKSIGGYKVAVIEVDKIPGGIDGPEPVPRMHGQIPARENLRALDITTWIRRRRSGLAILLGISFGFLYLCQRIWFPVKTTRPEALETLPDFKVELVRTATPTEGSWISMAKDPKGRLLIGAERMAPISRLTIKDGQVVQAEMLRIPLTEVMGMLCAFDSLYINGFGKTKDGREVFGLFRCRSSRGDDEYDQVDMLREWKDGAGDHGAHAILLNPDGKHLNIVCGNYTKAPEDALPSSPHRNYADDLVLPRAEDIARFDASRKPPGGFVVRMEPDGSHCELVAGGERNTYDVAFNRDGELFGFDSDMELDSGTPWYRPIRVFHATSGADHGFREGTAKWPEYYHDSLPATVTIGIGCPTGVAFGDGAKFPAKYQRAFFIEDWTYARLIAVHLTPEGSSYGGTWENFLAPKSLHENTRKTPLNMTGIVIGDDGAMYFTTGGRQIRGALYRITYTGTESTAPADLHDTKGADARMLRHQLETFHGHENASAVDFAWPQLASTDRFLRFAARIAIESQPVHQWKSRALAETNPAAALTALLAVARLGGAESQAELFASLAKFPLSLLKNEAEQLEKLRVIEVSLSRHGKPSPELAATLIAELSPLYPAKTIPLNRELCQILLALDAPGTIARTLGLVAAAPTQEEQLTYIFHLRTITHGWTPELRREYFAWWLINQHATQRPDSQLRWLPDLGRDYGDGSSYRWLKGRHANRHPDNQLRWFREAGRDYTDGSSFSDFLVTIRSTAVSNIPQQDLGTVQPVLDLLAERHPQQHVSKKQRAFVQDWKMADLEPDLARVGRGRNFAQGQDAVYAAQCLMCHRMGDEGGSVGPDLTAIASRFSRRDLLESILEPSKVVSEQFANTDIVLNDGSTLTGRVVSAARDTLVIRPSMLAAEVQEIRMADIKSREFSKLSPMPPGLLNLLTKEEILDLLAYFEAGGRSDGASFRR